MKNEVLISLWILNMHKCLSTFTIHHKNYSDNTGHTATRKHDKSKKNQHLFKKLGVIWKDCVSRWQMYAGADFYIYVFVNHDLT